MAQWEVCPECGQGVETSVLNKKRYQNLLKQDMASIKGEHLNETTVIALVAGMLRAGEIASPDLAENCMTAEYADILTLEAARITRAAKTAQVRLEGEADDR